MWIAWTLKRAAGEANIKLLLTITRERPASRGMTSAPQGLIGPRTAEIVPSRDGSRCALPYAGTATAMKHAVTRELFAYWDKRRGVRPLPDRADIEPGEIRRILGDTFIVTGDTGYPFRLAGTRVCAIFGRELRETPFMRLWDSASRAALAKVLTSTGEDQSGIVASATGRTADQRETMLEVLLLPLRHRETAGRMIGALVPMKIPYWLEVIPVERLTLGGLRHVGAIADEDAPPLVAQPTGARQREAFVVHQGGRRD